MRKYVYLIILLWGTFTMYSQNPKEIEITEWSESELEMNICNDPEYGIIVVNTNIPDLDFKILNAEKYLINQLSQQERNRYILCVKPVTSENKLIDTYNIQVTSKNIITNSFSVGNIQSQEQRFYSIFEKYREQICWEEYWSKGNEFFANAQYEEAKAEYYLASECNDVPDENDLNIKIEDCVAAIDSKRTADSYYNLGEYDSALREYEKVYAINQKDTYIQYRVNLCNEIIGNQLRTINGTVISASDMSPIAGVVIQVAYPETDSKGNIKTRWENVGGVTDWNGHYEVTIPQKVQQLQFVSNDQRKTGREVFPITSDKMDVVLKVVDLQHIEGFVGSLITPQPSTTNSNPVTVTNQQSNNANAQETQNNQPYKDRQYGAMVPNSGNAQVTQNNQQQQSYNTQQAIQEQSQSNNVLQNNQYQQQDYNNSQSSLQQQQSNNALQGSQYNRGNDNSTQQTSRYNRGNDNSTQQTSRYNRGNDNTTPQTSGYNRGNDNTTRQSRVYNSGNDNTARQTRGSNSGNANITRQTSGSNNGSNSGNVNTTRQTSGNNRGNVNTTRQTSGNNSGNVNSARQTSGNNSGNVNSARQTSGNNSGNANTTRQTSGNNRGNVNTTRQTSGNNSGNANTTRQTSGNNRANNNTQQNNGYNRGNNNTQQNNQYQQRSNDNSQNNRRR